MTNTVNFCSNQFLNVKQPTSFSVHSLLASGMDDQYSDMTVSTTTDHIPVSTANNPPTLDITPPRPDQPRVELDEKELWNRFNRLTNEMIVTKNGRFAYSYFHCICVLKC